jgi:hypothetical protein
MVRKHSWRGFTQEQADLLNYLDHDGNNGWARNPKSEEVMPKLMDDLCRAGLTIATIKAAMESIGYDKEDLHELDRWESKRTTGKFGR